MTTINNFLNTPLIGGYVNTNISSALAQIPTQTVVGKIGESFKAKKAGKNGSHVVLIVDESGSMGHLKSQTIDSVNEFISEQKKDAIENDTKTVVSIYKFDGRNVTAIIDKSDVENDPRISADNYNPVGMTNLNDAFGSVIAKINEDLSSVKKSQRPSIIISIMTDGAENSSRTFSISDVNQMVGKCQDKNWGFIFMGANIDAFSAGSQYGLGVNNTLQYAASGSGVNLSMASATRAVNSLKAEAKTEGFNVRNSYETYGFTDEERTKSMGSE